jgi:hypothetical protein
MNKKAEHEKEVLIELISAAKLQIDLSSIENRNPPEPDIHCINAQGAIYFELCRLLDQGMQRMILDMMHSAPEPVSPSNYNVKLPERELLKRKIEKKYQTEGKPLELVLYYDNTNWLVGDVPVFYEDFPSHAEHVMLPLCKSQNKFQRVWVYERHLKTVLWCYQSNN